MFQRRASFVAAVAALSIGSAYADSARVRVVHASPGAGAVDVLVNGGAAFTDVAFSDFSSYASLPAGTYEIQVVPAGASDPVLIDVDLPVGSNTDYTVLAINTPDAIAPLVLVDDNKADASNAMVRFVHASPNAPAVDIVVAGGPTLFDDVMYTESEYLSVAPGTYDLEARLSSNNALALSIPGVTLERGVVYTVAAVGLAGGDPALQAALAVDARATARVRAIHASPDAPNVDVLVNDGLAFENVGFTEATQYAEVPWGTYNVKVVATGGSDPVIEADLTLEPGATYSVAAVNSLAKIEAAVLADDNRGELDLAAVRFLHASPNAPAVDIALADGGPVLFPGVEFRQTGGYLSVPAGTYDLEARLSSNGAVVLSIPNVTFEVDTVNTALALGIVGGAPPLQAGLVIDAFLCPADVTKSSGVDQHDLFKILDDWGTCSDCDGDIDKDGEVGFNDLLRVLKGWGPCR